MAISVQRGRGRERTHAAVTTPKLLGRERNTVRDRYSPLGKRREVVALIEGGREKEKRGKMERGGWKGEREGGGKGRVKGR